MTTPKFQKDQFDQHVANGNYEVFTPEEVAAYYKDGITKSLNGELQDDEKKEFVADCMSLNKAVVVDGDKETTVYFRKSVVNWEVSEDGTIMKGIAGVYADVPVNRLLGRVGEAYIPDEGLMKSLDSMEDNAIAKAMRTGRYADTPENRRLHRVGQPYKKRASKGESEEDGGGKKPAEKGGLKTDAWNENISVKDLPKKYQMFTQDTLDVLKEAGAENVELSAYISSSGEETEDDSEIVAEGNMWGDKFKVTLQANGRGEVRLGKRSMEFRDYDDLEDTLDDWA